MPTQINHRSLLLVFLLICLLAACAAPPTATPSPAVTAATAASASSTPNLPSPSPTLASSPAPATRTPRATAFVEFEPTEPRGGSQPTPTSTVPTATPFPTLLPPPPTVVPHPLAISPDNVGQMEELSRLGKGYAYDVAWSPDGALLAVAGTLGVDLYNTQSFQQGSRISIFGQHVAFSPTGGNLVVVSDSWAWWVDLRTGQVLREVSTGMGGVSDIQFSPHGMYLALLGVATLGSGDPDYVLHVMNAATGETQFLRQDYGGTSGMGFSPDGRTLALGTEFGSSLLDSATGDELSTLPTGIYAPAFEPDGQLLVVMQAGNLAFIDVGTGQVTRELANPPTVHFLLNPAGLIVALLHSDAHFGLSDRLEFWDIAASQTEGEFPVLASFERFAFSPDGRRMAVISGSEAQVLDVASNTLIAALAYDESILSLEFSENTEVASGTPLIVVADSSGRLYSLDAFTGQTFGLERRVEGDLRYVAFSSGAGMVALGQWDGSITIQITDTGQQLAGLHCANHYLDDIVSSRDGRYFAAACDGVTVWDTSTWTLVAQRPDHRFLVPTADGRLLSINENASGFHLNDLISGDTVFDPIMPDGQPQNDFDDWALSPDLEFLAAGTTEGKIILWRFGELQPLLTWNAHSAFFGEGVSKGFYDLQFSPTSSLLVSSGPDDRTRVWNPASGASLVSLELVGRSLVNLTFSPDGRYLAGSTGGTLRVWGLPAP